MLTVSGTAEFVTNEKTQQQKLKLVVRIQPHVPVEHERLERVAASEGLAMETGNLVLEAELAVPEAASAPSSASSATSPSELLQPTEPPTPEMLGAGLGPEWLLPGDLVQWESQGVEQFAEPKRIAKLSEDGKFAFFEGSETGVPVEQLKYVVED